MPSTVKKKPGTERSKERSPGAETTQSDKSYQSPSEWAKQVIENLAEAQQIGLKLAARQNEIALKAMTEGFHLARAAPTPELREWARQGVEPLVTARKRWLEFAEEQSAQFLNAVKEGLKLEENSTGAALTDWAQEATAGYIATQKRLLDRASRLFQ